MTQSQVSKAEAAQVRSEETKSVKGVDGQPKCPAKWPA